MGTRLGQQLGVYRLLRLLGQGGFADVYLAEHIHLDRLVAIKVLQRRLIGDNLEMFRAEAQIVAHLNHPNIIHVIDFNVHNGSPFIVMDYAPGGSLRHQYPKETRLPVTRIISYVQQAAKALQYAHNQKLIHRDIKPENMLLGSDGNLLLSDFGLVQTIHTSSSQSTQEMAGTLLYMAPEQIQGKPRAASDQYALGVVTYEWFAGTPPFRGSLTEVVAQHLAASPPSLCARFPEIPSDLEQVIFKALAKESQQRFPDIQSFAHALERASQPLISSSSASFQKPLKSPLSESARPTSLIKQRQPSPYSTQAVPSLPESKRTQKALAGNAPSFRVRPARTVLRQSQDTATTFPTISQQSQAIYQQQGLYQQEEGEDRWMNLRWLILVAALLAVCMSTTGFFLHIPLVLTMSLIPVAFCLVLGLLQTGHFDQWYWFLGFLFTGPLTGLLYAILNPEAKPSPPINVRQLIIVVACMGYILFPIALFASNGVILYGSGILVLASWLLGLIRSVRLKRDVKVFFFPLTFFIAGIFSVWDQKE